jgi:hypothetical protein
MLYLIYIGITLISGQIRLGNGRFGGLSQMSGKMKVGGWPQT